MKKSRFVKLVLITSALASCNKPGRNNEWQNGNKVYMRSDTTAPYSRTHPSGWFYAFRPYGYYSNMYYRSGYYSDAISEGSNIGFNSTKGSIVRGGFGEHGGFGVSS